MEERLDELGVEMPSSALVETDNMETLRQLTDPQQIVALDKIEAIFENIVDSLANSDKQLLIQLKRKDNTALLRRSAASPRISASPSSSFVIEKRICFPGRTPQDAWRFSQEDGA